MSAEGSFDALVLRVTPFGDADLVVQLFARKAGRVGAFARAARKSRKRFGGALEPFQLLRVELEPRRRGDLIDLKSAEILESNAGIRSDLGRLAHAGYATELARELVHEHAANDRLFDTLHRFLTMLSTTGAKSLALRAFELQALDAAGFRPHLSSCVSCRRAWAIVEPVAFDLDLGGAVCRGCRGAGPASSGVATITLLAALQDGGLEAAARADELHLPLEAAADVLRAFVDRHIQHELKSLSFLRDVGAPP